MKVKVFNILFIIVAAVELIGELAQDQVVIYISKPLLMITLFLFYRVSITSPIRLFHKLIMTAFVFAWMGDFFLMFTDRDEAFFLLGLLSFLITHVLYAWAFVYSVQKKKETPFIFKKPYFILPVLAYGAVFLSFLYPHLGEMKIPVIIYSIAILTMVICAMNRYGKIATASFWMVLIGATLFMFSDSLIAINKFAQSFETARIFIMLTYIVGQYYIAVGCARNGADVHEKIPVP